jgi:hypothetical protein
MQLLQRKRLLQVKQVFKHLKGYLIDYSIKYDSAAISQLLEDVQLEQPVTQGLHC